MNGCVFCSIYIVATNVVYLFLFISTFYKKYIGNILLLVQI